MFVQRILAELCLLELQSGRAARGEDRVGLGPPKLNYIMSARAAKFLFFTFVF